MPLWPCPKCNVSNAPYMQTRGKGKRREDSETEGRVDRVGAEMQKTICIELKKCLFMSREWASAWNSLTSLWSRVHCSQDSGDGVGLHQTGRLDWIVTVTLQEEERDAEAGRQRQLHKLAKCPKICANLYSSAIFLILIR